MNIEKTGEYVTKKGRFPYVRAGIAAAVLAAGVSYGINRLTEHPSSSSTDTNNPYYNPPSPVNIINGSPDYSSLNNRMAGFYNGNMFVYDGDQNANLAIKVTSGETVNVKFLLACEGTGMIDVGIIGSDTMYNLSIGQPAGIGEPANPSTCTNDVMIATYPLSKGVHFIAITDPASEKWSLGANYPIVLAE